VVTNTDTQSGTLTNGYTYTNPAPTVTSISPTSGPAAGATAVTITGTGFLSGATVTMGGTAATNVVVVSSTSITAKTAAHAAGAVNVVVTNTDTQGGTLTNGYTYTNPAPTVTSISPTSGPAAGATAVTITGTNFLTGATVTLGGNAATNVVVVSSTSITAKTAAHAAGAVNVVVTNTDTQSGTLTNGYSYTNPAPTVTSISPTTGPATGGTPVTIGGTGFLSGATVTLGGTAATSVVVVNSTTITATTAAHAAGAVNVVVTNTDTQSGTLTSGFTYSVSSTVSSISPTSIGAGTPGFQLTVTGTNFSNGGSTVEFNGTALSTTFVNSTTLTAIVPTAEITTAGSATITVPGASGSGTLTVESAVTIAWDTSLSVNIPGLTSFGNFPARLAFDSADASLFVAEQQTGNIDRVTISHGVTTVAVWATVPVYTSTANPNLGLLGMALDPSNPPSAGGVVYVFYTASSSENLIGKVSKGGSTTNFSTSLPVAGSTDLPYLNGGKLAVHKDPTSGITYVYASTGGSDVDESLSQDPSSLSGKILRFDTSGNMKGAFSGTATYACGTRNSFGFDFHPDGALYSSDNGNEGNISGATAWYDALDRISPGGGNSEGFGFTTSAQCTSSVTDALLGGNTNDSFRTQSQVPSGTIFYTNPLMPQLQNTVLVAGYYVTTIYQYAVDEYDSSNPGNVVSSKLVIDLSSSSAAGVFYPTDLVQGPDGCVYVSVAYDPNTTTQFIYRFTKSGGSCQ
jgi:glucose/arabinose dehydrogenase